MSKSQRKRKRPTKLQRLQDMIENQIAERNHFEQKARETLDPNEKRVAWVRAQEAKELIAKYSRELRDYGRRKLVPEPAPLFKFNNQEI